MKKLSIVFAVILLLSVVGLCGKAKKTEVVPQDTTSLRLFDAIGQNLQINYTYLGKRIYFIDDIKLSRADVAEKKLCFMLNVDFIITDVTVNDKTIQIRKYRNVNSKGFEPNIDPEVYKQISKNIAIYEFVLDDLTNAPEHIVIRLKYHLVDRESNKVYTNYKDKIMMSGTEFWYPRNLNKDENINLTVKTTDQIAFSLNSKAVNYTRPKKYQKEYKTNLIDPKDGPAYIIFMKKS